MGLPQTYDSPPTFYYILSMAELVSFQNFINESFLDWDLQYRVHATKRMFQRNITEDELLQALGTGFVIEDYENDFPFPSVLVNGKTTLNRPIHLVVGIDKNSKRLYIITVYEPDLVKWIDDYNRRII